MDTGNEVPCLNGSSGIIVELQMMQTKFRLHAAGFFILAIFSLIHESPEKQLVSAPGHA
jgi:hypothetical protein